MVSTRGVASIAVVAAMVITACAGAARADFILIGSEHLDVTTAHTTGTLNDFSTADVLEGGSIADAFVYDDALLRVCAGGSVSTPYAYNASSISIAGGCFGNVMYAYDSSSIDVSGTTSRGSWLHAFNASSVAISGGLIDGWVSVEGSSSVLVSEGVVYHVSGFENSTVSISGGSVPSYVEGRHNASVDITGGSISGLYTRETTSVAVSGGSVSELKAFDSSAVNISGGEVSGLYAYDSSTVVFFAQDFQFGAGLSLDGNRVLGTGILSGEWFDSTSWEVDIYTNDSGATILAVPEPAALSLLALGGLALLCGRRISRRRQGEAN